MKRLGISIYPEHATLEENIAYIDRAADRGFSRIFSCLLSVEKSKEEIKDEFTSWISHAHKRGMEVMLDVAPYVFQRLGLSYTDLSFFHDIGADGIRLDEGFDGMKEAQLTRNLYGLKIEFNASGNTEYVPNILSLGADKDKMVTCHNFYPLRYSGLSWPYFLECSRKYKGLGLPVAAFVSCQDSNAFGPWPNRDGLCTVEDHRSLPMDVAARHLFATGLVDDAIIANCFPTDEELDSLAAIPTNKLGLKAKPHENISEAERKALFDFGNHVVRGDVSDYMARSSSPRMHYCQEEFPPNNVQDIEVGDILVVNDLDPRYKGEVQIALRPMKNDGTKNVAAKIPENEHILLEWLKSWTPFELLEVK